MRRLQQIAPLLVLAGALSTLLLPGAARAQVSVTPTVLFDGTLYNYDYSVANPSLAAFDLAIVTLDVLPLSDAVLNPMAPTGFLISFDPGVGQLSFLEDADPATPQTFAPGLTVSGFKIQSPYAPSPTSFAALDLAGGTFTGATVGPSTTPGTTVIPEPSTLFLCLAAAPGLILVSLRRSKR